MIMVPSGIGYRLDECYPMSPQAVGWEAGKPARSSSTVTDSTPPDALRAFCVWLSAGLHPSARGKARPAWKKRSCANWQAGAVGLGHRDRRERVKHV